MVLDVVLLTGLICVTGGPTNPFSIFYLVNVVLAAVVLRPVWGWRLGALATACYAAFFLGHRRLPALEIGETSTAEQAARAWALHKSGMFVAFATATIIVVYFFTRLTREIKRLEDELLEARARKARSERIEALGTLAAGAAHELSSPLSTIAVVARELERELQVPGELEHAATDARLIRSEVARCRAILDQMSAEAGESAGESPQSLTVEDLVDSVLENVGEADRARVRVRIGAELAAVRLLQPRRALAQALRGLIQNALDASGPGQEVRLVATRAASGVSVEVQDDGAGMDPSTLQRAGDPFFTTKEPGRGMGLGLFLARSVAERLGGSLAIDSQRGRGTTVRVVLPLPAGKDGP
jgi:two-component system sensor histidine kinase RegB